MNKFLAEADWLTADRARAWRNVLLVMSFGFAIGWCVLSRSGVDPFGRALGTDFLSFYAASKLVLSGHALAVYDVGAHRAAEVSVFGRDVGYAAYFYPPLFLLVCAPLAAAPYLAALGLWLAATGAAFLATLRAWMEPRLGWLTALAFPAVLFNAAHGQNAFLAAALIGLAALWLDRRPWLAGVALGLLAFKPHLGLAAPVVLLAAGRWRTIVAAGATLAAFAAASVAVFGVQAWTGFLSVSPLARATLEQGFVEPGKMVSAFAAARVLGAPVSVAYAAQAVVVVGAMTMVLRPPGGRGPAAAPLFILAALLDKSVPARLRPRHAGVPARLAGGAGPGARFSPLGEDHPPARLRAAPADAAAGHAPASADRPCRAVRRGRGGGPAWAGPGGASRRVAQHRTRGSARLNSTAC